MLSKSPSVRHVPAFDQAADILTKPISAVSFLRLRSKLKVGFNPLLSLTAEVKPHEDVAQNTKVQRIKGSPNE